MFERVLVFLCVLASVYPHPKDVEIKSTTQKTPEPKSRFFGLENIFGQIFNGPGYNNYNPQTQYNDWQHMMTPDQAQSNLNQQLQTPTLYPQQGGFSQNNFGPGSNSNQNLSPVQFPNQQQVNMDQYPIQSNPQGNFNGNNFGQNQNYNTGTLDDIQLQNGIGQNPAGNLNFGNQFQNQNQRNPNQLLPSQNSNQNQNQRNQNQLLQNQNGNQMLQNQNQRNQNQNGNQMVQNQIQRNQNQRLQNQNGNQMLQNQNPQVGDYNPVAILGKPVTVTTSAPDSIVFEDGCDTPTQRQCVQDCQSSSEYRPVCGSNNVTYFNPGRFICARNCGVNVFIQRDGRCRK